MPIRHCRLINPSIHRPLRDLVPYVLQTPLTSSIKRIRSDDAATIVPISEPPSPPNVLPTVENTMRKRLRGK